MVLPRGPSVTRRISFLRSAARSSTSASLRLAFSTSIAPTAPAAGRRSPDLRDHFVWHTQGIEDRRRVCRGPAQRSMNGGVAEDGVVAIVSDDEDGHGAACRIPESALQSLPQLEVLFDSTAKGLGLPGPLARAYGGDLSLAGDCLVANFVESVDGGVGVPEGAGGG